MAGVDGKLITAITENRKKICLGEDMYWEEDDFKETDSSDVLTCGFGSENCFTISCKGNFSDHKN